MTRNKTCVFIFGCLDSAQNEIADGTVDRKLKSNKSKQKIAPNSDFCAINRVLRPFDAASASISNIVYQTAKIIRWRIKAMLKAIRTRVTRRFQVGDLSRIRNTSEICARVLTINFIVLMRTRRIMSDTFEFADTKDNETSAEDGVGE